MAALLLFLVCATVGSVILAAASTSAGRASKADTDANRQRYSLESAAQMIEDDMTATDTNASVAISQSWSYQTVSADFALVNDVSSYTTYSDSDTTTTKKLLSDSSTYVTDLAARVCDGDFVIPLDLTTSTDTDDYNSGGTYSVLAENDNSGIVNSWSNKWNTTSTVDYSSYMAVDSSGNTTGKSTSVSSISSFNVLRDLMAEAIFRNYWYTINRTTRSALVTVQSTEYSDTSPLYASKDPWGETALHYDWDDIVAEQGGYTISTPTSDPLVIEITNTNGAESNVETVYADVSMDQDFVMTFHLYCSDSETPDSSDSSIEMYLTYSPSDNMPSLTYTNSITSKTESTYSGCTFYVKQGNMSDVCENNDSTLKARYPGYILDNIKWGTQVTGTNLWNVTFDYYSPIDATSKTINTITRGVKLNVTWDSAEVSTQSSTSSSSSTDSSTTSSTES